VSVLAIGTAATILAWLGLALGVVVLLAVMTLFNRIVNPALEIRRYAGEILEAGLGIGRNLDGVDHLARTRELGGGVPDLAVAYLRRAQGGRS
jgi:hypothetical protein